MFMITPPLPGEKGYGYSIVTINDFAETILVRLVEWQSNDYWKFWVDECRALVEGERGKGVLPMAVYRIVIIYILGMCSATKRHGRSFLLTACGWRL